MPRAKRATGGEGTGPSRRPAKKTAYHHGDLRRALVVAAVDLVGSRGPEALTLREVAAQVGVTHPAAYRHFEDKTALLAAVAEDGYLALGDALAAGLARAGDLPRDRVRALAAAYVGFAVERPAHYRVMWGPRLNTEGRFPSLEAAISRVFELVAAEMGRGQELGAFRDGSPRDLAIAMWVSAHGYVELVAQRRIKVRSPKVAVDYFLTLFEPWLDGLASGKPASRRAGG